MRPVLGCREGVGLRLWGARLLLLLLALLATLPGEQLRAQLQVIELLGGLLLLLLLTRIPTLCLAPSVVSRVMG